jgi:hypothetical protein
MEIGSELFDWGYPETAHSVNPDRTTDEMRMTPLAHDAVAVEASNNSPTIDTRQMENSASQPASFTSPGGAKDDAVYPQSSGAETESSLTSQMATRYGRLHLAEDGQSRYYGATSNMHLFPNGMLSLFQDSVRSVRADGAKVLQDAGLSWAGNKTYEDHLTNLFFTWHAPVLQEVDKDIYFREKRRFHAGRDTSLYSLTLENAM